MGRPVVQDRKLSISDLGYHALFDLLIQDSDFLDRSTYKLVNRQGEPAATSKYGPEDFITEIVRLDKNALDKYFPAAATHAQKPLVLGTDTVTSSSVKVNKISDGC